MPPASFIYTFISIPFILLCWRQYFLLDNSTSESKDRRPEVMLQLPVHVDFPFGLPALSFV
jgi:hypothetical protein